MNDNEDTPAYGSLLLDSERTSYRAIGTINGLNYYIRQTVDGSHDMTSTLPPDTYYVYDAAKPHRI